MSGLATMRRILSDALAKTELPNDVCHIVGQPFIFGEGHHLIVGTIRSIDYAPKEGITLYVSSPRFRGMDIKSLVRKDDRWYAISEDGESKLGEFFILS